jgi:hypothetical protein
MTALLIGYARCSTDQQDLTAQPDGLAALGVDTNRTYVAHGLTSTNRERLCLLGLWPHAVKVTLRSSPSSTGWPGHCQSPEPSPMSSPWAGPAQPGRILYDPMDPVGRLLFNVLATVAEFESDSVTHPREDEGR